ncbi:MAG: LmbE family protein [Acidimicrobiaceae bacterium]|nr:LmbE family protein [Acidimicrobiaceae bacterium]
MMARSDQLTLMAVHAHPDDEASSTGGILARYSDEGIRTVLVTCTRGELGDGPGGVKPGDPAHDEAVVVETRQAELEASCAVLGVSHLEMLGYHDSGMMGWPQNTAPGAFWNTPVAEGAERLGKLIAHYEPQVVVTYDSNGFYGHPDHIQAHRITVAALDATPGPAKLYYPTFPRSAFADFVAVFAEEGLEAPPDEELAELGTPDELVTTYVDCSLFVGRKRAALAAHASQSDNIFFLRLGDERFMRLFGTEAFVRMTDTTGAALPENDLFAGLR